MLPFNHEYIKIPTGYLLFRRFTARIHRLLAQFVDRQQSAALVDHRRAALFHHGQLLGLCAIVRIITVSVDVQTVLDHQIVKLHPNVEGNFGRVGFQHRWSGFRRRRRRLRRSG